MSKQATKLKKLKKREQNNKQRKLVETKRRSSHERRRLYSLSYPKFQLDTVHGDPGFVQTVRQVLATINFEDETIFPTWQTELYRRVKQDGTAAVMDILSSFRLDCHETGDATGRLAEISFSLGLGQAVFDRIPEAKREKYLPLNDMMFVPSGNHIRVIFRSLLRAKGPGGTIYYSRRKPTLELDGQQKIVAYSIHAIKQTCERLKSRWKTSYAALGDAFAFFDQCTYFEPCELHGGQLAFTFYDECNTDRVQYCYVTDVLGEENLDRRAGRPHYRLGYCPAVIEGDFIKAKTLLLPGYGNTPEYDAIVNSDLSWSEKRELIDKAKGLTATRLYESQDFSLIKWFQDHGVPQVVHLNRRVFVSVA